MRISDHLVSGNHSVRSKLGSVPTVYGLRQIDRLLPSAEGTTKGSRWKFLHLRQLAELRMLQNLLPFDSSFGFISVEIMLKISKIKYYLSYLSMLFAIFCPICEFSPYFKLSASFIFGYFAEGSVINRRFGI